MNERTWDQKYAFYAASLFSLGHYIDAGLVSAIMFERYIEDEISSFEDLQKSYNGDFLKDAIEKLSRKNSSKYDFSLLDELRRIRNKEIIHPQRLFKGLTNSQHKQDVKDKIAKITRFVWKVMDPETFHRYQSLSGIPFLKADYAVMEIRELFQDNMQEGKGGNYKSVKVCDFENLFSMRNKIFHLARHAQERLLTKYKNLDIDIISKVDTTSAYVWLAMNLHKEAEDGLRDRISGASASLLATPLDFRIYLDFGGEAEIDREDYYTFLQSEECEDFLEAYANEHLEMFDVDWYCFVIKRQKIQDLTTHELDVCVSGARTLLKAYKHDCRIISWNRNLLGFILDRQEINFSEVLEKLETVIKLYYFFEKFRDGFLARKVDFPWLPQNEYLLDPTKSVLNGYKLF